MDTITLISSPNQVLYLDLRTVDTSVNETGEALIRQTEGDVQLIDKWIDFIGQLTHQSIDLIIINQQVFKEMQYPIVDTVEMINTMTKFCMGNKRPKISVLIEDTKCGSDFIKELKSCGIAGIIPNPVTLSNLSMMALTDLLDGVQHWPKEFINEIANKKKKQKANSTNPEDQLTSRQHQIYELIAQRGLSNKQIANSLRISESTVKIHVSAIMKAFCVRNRTQLALSAIQINGKQS